MRTRRRLTAALLGAAVVLATLGAAPAPAALSPVIGDCQLHGALTHRYTAGQLRQALNTLPPIVSEYTSCADAIHRALVAQLGHAAGGAVAGSSGGSSFLPAWLIAVLAVVVAGGLGAALAARRRP